MNSVSIAAGLMSEAESGARAASVSRRNASVNPFTANFAAQ